MASTIATLLVEIGVKFDGFTKGIKDVEKKVGGLGGKFKNFQKTSKVVWAAVGLAAVKGLMSVTKAAADFETDLTHLGNISKITGKDLTTLGTQAQIMGAKFGVSSNEVVHGLTEMAKLGYSTRDSLKVLPNILKFTATANTTLGTSVRIVETALKDFNLGIDKTGHVLDIIQTGLNKSGLSADDFKNGLKKAGATGKLAKASISDVAAAITILGVKGFSGSEAGTALNAIFGKLAKSSGPAAKGLQKIGISSFDSQGKLKTFPTILDEVKGKWGTLTDAQKLNTVTAIAGTEHQAKLVALIEGSGESFAAYSKSIEDNKGVVDSFFSNLDKTAGQSFKKLESVFGTFAQNIGKVLGPAIKAVVDLITDLIDWFNNLDPATQGVITTLGLVALALVAIGAAVAIITPAIAGLGTLFAILTSPISLIILAIAALVAGFIYLWKTSKGFRDFFIGAWKAIVSAFNTAVNGIKTGISAIGNFFTNLISSARTWGSNLVKGFADGIRGAIGSVVSAAKAVASTVKSFLGIHSPAEMGPLATADKWMPNLMKMFSQGLEMGIPMLQMAVGDVAASIDLTPNANGTTNRTNNISIYPRKTNLDANALNRELTRMSWLNGGLI